MRPARRAPRDPRKPGPASSAQSFLPELCNASAGLVFVIPDGRRERGADDPSGAGFARRFCGVRRCVRNDERPATTARPARTTQAISCGLRGGRPATRGNPGPASSAPPFCLSYATLAPGSCLSFRMDDRSEGRMTRGPRVSRGRSAACDDASGMTNGPPPRARHLATARHPAPATIARPDRTTQAVSCGPRAGRPATRGNPGPASSAPPFCLSYATLAPGSCLSFRMYAGSEGQMTRGARVLRGGSAARGDASGMTNGPPPRASHAATARSRCPPPRARHHPAARSHNSGSFAQPARRPPRDPRKPGPRVIRPAFSA